MKIYIDTHIYIISIKPIESDKQFLSLVMLSAVESNGT